MTSPQQRLLDRLPSVRGRYTENAPLAGITWFRVGGAAEVSFRPADQEDLLHFLRQKPHGVPVTVLGVGSNTLVRDGGIEGVVLRLGRAFASVEQDEEGLIAGAAALDVNVAEAARRATLSGLEFLSGIPGTIGGALRMNAGAYGREIRDVLRWAEAVTPKGEIKRLRPEEMGLSYRTSRVPTDWIFLRAALAATPGEPQTIEARMDEIRSARSGTQPIRSRTGGSTFKNPPGQKAWQLIDAAGGRGLKHGGAQVSEQHCNFLINLGEATARDLEELGEEIRRRVREHSGIHLEWEIRRVGRPSEEGS
ncbi:MAG TPA: UDP-N-acetylmuramate dehydrogenase [Kiloniellales bacterium]|nr:UDP-N-acetylmuramate dehydrogenase [Kiloniellales bacterium]